MAQSTDRTERGSGEGHTSLTAETASASRSPVDRHEMLRRITAAAAADPRVVGLGDYGSSSEGRDDAWSDVDVEVFIRDDDFKAFEREWVAWASGFGRLLLSFVGDIDNHWTVYDGTPAPLRVDFSLHRASEIPSVDQWPNAPLSVERMLLVDKTGGALTAKVAAMVGRDLGPPDVPHRFTLTCAGFWYYAVRTWCKLQRGPSWGVRYDITSIMHGLLMALLRMEVGKVSRWRAADAAADIERDIAPRRLRRLDACIPGPDPTDLAPALHRIVTFGREVSAAAATRYGRPWPEELGDRMVALTAPSDSSGVEER